MLICCRLLDKVYFFLSPPSPPVFYAKRLTISLRIARWHLSIRDHQDYPSGDPVYLGLNTRAMIAFGNAYFITAKFYPPHTLDYLIHAYNYANFLFGEGWRLHNAGDPWAIRAFDKAIQLVTVAGAFTFVKPKEFDRNSHVKPRPQEYDRSCQLVLRRMWRLLDENTTKAVECTELRNPGPDPEEILFGRNGYIKPATPARRVVLDPASQ